MMELPSLLHAQDDNLSQMQGLLAEEFDLLKAHRALALPALAERKQQLLEAIETLDKRLAELPDLQRVLPQVELSLPVWLCMHEDLRHSAAHLAVFRALAEGLRAPPPA